MKIHKRIILVRQSKGYTIAQVAKGINKSTYDRIETGKIEPKFSELLAICKFLEIKIWELTAEELVIRFTG